MFDIHMIRRVFMYSINDLSTSNFVGSNSVFITPSDIIFCSYTGEADGIEYYKTEEVAEQILQNLQILLQKYGITKYFTINHINRADIPEGILVKEYFHK